MVRALGFRTMLGCMVSGSVSFFARGEEVKGLCYRDHREKISVPAGTIEITGPCFLTEYFLHLFSVTSVLLGVEMFVRCTFFYAATGVSVLTVECSAVRIAVVAFRPEAVS